MLKENGFDTILQPLLLNKSFLIGLTGYIVDEPSLMLGIKKT